MDSDCRALIAERIRQRGPMTAADYIELALYAPEVGYYARAAQRSGRTGDFVTSVDVGPVFGALLASYFARLTQAAPFRPGQRIDLVEAAAGNGRLSRDVLEAGAARHPAWLSAVDLHLVERSAHARAAQAAALGPHAARLRSSGAGLPAHINGILFANELLDAFPVHRVQMTPRGLAEIYVDADGDDLCERLGPLSSPALAAYLDEAGIAFADGQRGEINLAAVAWITEAAACLAQGYLVLIDYGYEAEELYSPARADGTLTTFHRHVADARTGTRRATPPWLDAPGTRDITSHVDFTAVRRAAERAGLTRVLQADQTRFLLDIVEQSGLVAELSAPGRDRDRLALKTLLLPGGLGSTHKAVVFARGIV
jgi:SAM-dependent MidA family methyltransferase